MKKKKLKTRNEAWKENRRLKKKKVKMAGAGSCMGLDVSMSGTGVTIIDSSTGVQILTTVIEPKPKLIHKLIKEKYTSLIQNVDRVQVFLKFNFILAQLSVLIAKYKVEFVSIEGYAFGAHSKSVTKLAELGSLVRMMLIDFGIPWIEITPSQNKKFISGKGNTPKALIVKEVYKKWGKDFEDIKPSLQLDAADSWGMGLLAYYIFTGNYIGLKKPDIALVKQIQKLASQSVKEKRK